MKERAMQTHKAAHLRPAALHDARPQRSSAMWRWFARVAQRASDARRRRRECEVLMRMTPRELRDIGLTRDDALAICRGWPLSRDERRDDERQPRQAA